jgi:hypothetical protein
MEPKLAILAPTEPLSTLFAGLRAEVLPQLIDSIALRQKFVIESHIAAPPWGIDR